MRPSSVLPATLYPPAKLNIGLKVFHWPGHRLHRLVSLFVPVSLCDRMRIEPGAFSIAYFDDSGNALTVTNDILDRVRVNAGLSKAEIPFSVTVEKKIPMGAGLGGGSSDAAAFIRHLAEVGLIRRRDMHAIARLSGSDVPFFLDSVPSVVWGVGDKMRALSRFPALHAVIVWPEAHFDTAGMYARLDARTPPPVSRRDRIRLEREYRTTTKKFLQIGEKYVFFSSAITENDFEQVLTAEENEFLSLKNEFRDAIYTGMSGSGSSIFGLYENISDASLCHSRLTNLRKYVFLVHTVN